MGCLCSADFSSATKVPQRCLSAYSNLDTENSPGIFLKTYEKNFYANYKLGKEIIGYGSHGEIRLCTKLSTGKEFAVKILNKALIPVEAIKNRIIYRQVKMLSVLNHPSILKIHEFYEDNSNYYITMDYIKEGDLFAKMEKTQIFSEEKAARIMKQIFSALAHMHSLKIAHRDIKPENIMIQESDSEILIKIIDFDTAISFENKILTDKQGSLYYMSPEVLHEEYNEKCDV